MNHVYKDKIEERDVTAEQQHRDDHDQGRINQLLVSADTSLLWIPRPGSFLELDQPRQEGLEPPTGGFGDRYSTN